MGLEDAIYYVGPVSLDVERCHEHCRQNDGRVSTIYISLFRVLKYFFVLVLLNRTVFET